MKTGIQRFALAMLVAHAVAMPITGAELIAAPIPDPAASPTATATATAPGSVTSIIQSGSAGYASQSTPYFTDSYGNILMNVNVWGTAVHTGPITVPEGSDLATVISIAGGPAKDANVKKIRVNRSQPDRDGKMTYLVDLKNYMNAGDRSMLLDIQPNDTIIIPERKSFDSGLILGIIAVGVSIYSIGR
jgi:hypothetical protein